MLNTMLADIFQASTLTRLIPSERIDSCGVVDMCCSDQLNQVVNFSNVSPVKLLCGCVIIFMFESSIMCAGSSAE